MKRNGRDSHGIGRNITLRRYFYAEHVNEEQNPESNQYLYFECMSVKNNGRSQK